MSVGNIIMSLREDSDLTQKELAVKLEINRSVLNRIEQGTRPVRDDELKKMSLFFGVSSDYLLGITDTPNAAGNVSDARSADPPRRILSPSHAELHRIIDRLPEDEVVELLALARMKDKRLHPSGSTVQDEEIS